MVGRQAGMAVTTGQKNVLLGVGSGEKLTTGDQNILIGNYAGSNLVDDEKNEFIGNSAASNISSGEGNICIGDGSQVSNNSSTNWEATIGSNELATFRIPGLDDGNSSPYRGFHVTKDKVTQAGCFWENDTTVTANYTITNGRNAMAAGPITIASGVTVTVGSGETLTIV